MTSPSGAAVDAVREQVKQYFETHITDARDGAVQYLREVEGTAVDTVRATAEQVTGPHVEATRLDREATADHVVEAGGHAQDAAASASLAAQHAEGVSHAEARAGEHEDLARGHEDEARVQAEAAAGHADRADGHATSAAGSATAAATHEDTARQHAEAAGGHEQAAGAHAQTASTASTDALEAADRIGTAEQVGVWHTETLGARDDAYGARDDAVAAAEQATTGIPDGAVTRPKLAEDVVSELEAKAEQEDLDELVAPRGLHGTLIVDPITLDPAGVTIMFPRPAPGETTIRVDYSSLITGNSQALVGFMFRGPDGEKALDGMDGLGYSIGVGEPYRYMPVVEGERTVWSHTVTPDEGWTIDGIIIRSWRASDLDGAGNITIHAFAADDGSNPLVATRDFYGGIAVPEIPVSPASATSRKWVVERLDEKADQQVMNDVLENKSNIDHTHTSADITDSTSSTGRPEHARRLVRTDVDGFIYSYNDPTHDSQVARKRYVDSEVGKKSDASHSHTAADVGARPDTWMPTAAQVGARPTSWTPTASEVGARPDTWVPTPAQVGTTVEVTGDQWPSTGEPGVIYWQEEEE